MAVLGVFLTEGRENRAFLPVWKAMPTEKTSEQSIRDVQVNLTEMLPSDRDSFRYFGSLTTPPCSEIVRWVVFETPLELSRAQIEQFRQNFPLKTVTTTL